MRRRRRTLFTRWASDILYCEWIKWRLWMSCDHRMSRDHRTLCDHRTSHDHRDCVKEGIPLNYCSVSKNRCTIHFCHIIDRYWPPMSCNIMETRCSERSRKVGTSWLSSLLQLPKWMTEMSTRSQGEEEETPSSSQPGFKRPLSQDSSSSVSSNSEQSRSPLRPPPKRRKTRTSSSSGDVSTSEELSKYP